MEGSTEKECSFSEESDQSQESQQSNESDTNDSIDNRDGFKRLDCNKDYCVIAGSNTENSLSGKGFGPSSIHPAPHIFGIPIQEIGGHSASDRRRVNKSSEKNKKKNRLQGKGRRYTYGIPIQKIRNIASSCLREYTKPSNENKTKLQGKGRKAVSAIKKVAKKLKIKVAAGGRKAQALTGYGRSGKKSKTSIKNKAPKKKQASRWSAAEQLTGLKGVNSKAVRICNYKRAPRK
jgi:hypothetical protein